MLYEKNQHIANYIVLFPIKQGAYAETYRVKDTDGNLRFLKLICSTKLNASQLDEKGNIIEIEISKQLKNHNVCNYIDSGALISNGRQYFYLVTEFVSGETLSQRLLRERNLSVYDIKQIAIAILSALRFLHSRGTPIIHNDITLQNVMLDLRGDFKDAKLIDFGSARFLDNPSIDNLPDANLFYLAPERFNGICCVQSDLYAVGAMIYQLLFDMQPWFIDLSKVGEQDKLTLIRKEREKPLLLPNIDLFELDTQLLNIVTKALEIEPDNRFQSADEFIKAINGEIKINSTTLQKTSEVKKEDSKLKKRGNGFADVAGMDDLKKMLYNNVINILKDKDRAKKYKLAIPNGMLLYGPPGCGKSFFAEKFAEETGYNYIYVRSSDLASIYVHGSQEKIGKLFDQAREESPTIICFDEFDALVPRRDGINNASEAGEVNEFLSQLNNCGQDGVFVIASTNKPDLIDNAILRKGRIDIIVYLPTPDQVARIAMFKLNLKGRPFDFGIDYEHLGQMTDGYVSSDIAYIVNESARIASMSGDKITQKIIEDTITQTHSSIKKEDIRKYEYLKDNLEGNSKRTQIGFKKEGE
jgi:transitional endoplasmic reticulum ATPase